MMNLQWVQKLVIEASIKTIYIKHIRDAVKSFTGGVRKVEKTKGNYLNK